MFRNPTADLLVVLLIVLLIFGPKRLPILGRQLGQGLREFKDSITGDSKDEDEDDAPRTQIAPTASAPIPSPVAPPAATKPQSEAAEQAPGFTPERESAEIGSERNS